MVSAELVERCVARVRQEVPDAVAVFLAGSQVRGEAGPFSDVDFDVIVPEGPRDEYPAWFDRDGGKLVRVSLWIRDVDQWLGDEANPQSWAYWLTCTDVLRLCWVADESWRARLARSELTHPAGEPELDHFIGDLGKVANAYLAGDELALRLAAQDLARSAPSLLAPLNPGPPVGSRYAALRAALDVDIAPGGYRADLLTCLGLTGGPTTVEDVHTAATRLATGVVDLLETHASGYAALLPADLAGCLTDGSLRRYISQPCART
jgi:predicted nucleotidyltransferase